MRPGRTGERPGGARGEDNAQLRAAKATLETAWLNLEFTRMNASVDGYVTTPDLRLGSQAVADQPTRTRAWSSDWNARTSSLTSFSGTPRSFNSIAPRTRVLSI